MSIIRHSIRANQSRRLSDFSNFVEIDLQYNLYRVLNFYILHLQFITSFYALLDSSSLGKGCFCTIEYYTSRHILLLSSTPVLSMFLIWNKIFYFTIGRH